MHHPLSQRELLELSDRLLEHEAHIEKAGFLASQAQSQELQQMIRRHQQTHVRHYNDMLSLLRQSKQQSGAGSSHYTREHQPENFGHRGMLP